MTFIKHDAGNGHRGWDTGDCTVRCLVTALGWPYEKAWERLYELQGDHKATSFKLAEFLRRDPAKLNVVRHIRLKAERGSKRMTPEMFCKVYPVGRFILRCAHHMTVVVNGRHYDTWNCSKKCVYSAWEVAWRP